MAQCQGGGAPSKAAMVVIMMGRKAQQTCPDESRHEATSAARAPPWMAKSTIMMPFFFTINRSAGLMPDQPP